MLFHGIPNGAECCALLRVVPTWSCQLDWQDIASGNLGFGFVPSDRVSALEPVPPGPPDPLLSRSRHFITLHQAIARHARSVPHGRLRSAPPSL